MKFQHLAFLFLTSIFSTSAFAQTPAFPVPGKFYLEVDDAVGIYHNGKKMHQGKLGVSTTGELNLMPGDRLVINLWNKGGPYGFKLLFVSTDRKTMINFTADAFRVLRDPEKHDLTEKEFTALKESAGKVKHRRTRDHLAFKNKAEWFWGEKKLGDTYLAGLITKGMFENFSQ